MVFNSVAELSAALAGRRHHRPGSDHGHRLAVGRPRRPPRAHRRLRLDARGEGHGPLGHPAPGGTRRRAFRFDSRPLHGDGPWRGERLHRAGHQRAHDGLRHRPRRDARRQGPRCRRLHPRDRALARSATPNSGRTSTRPSWPPPRCARASAGRSSCRATTCRWPSRSTPRPTATRNSTRCATSSAKRSPPASTTSTSTPRRSSISTSRRSKSSRPSTASSPPTSRRSSAATSRRASPCRWAARSAKWAARTPTSTSCTPTCRASTRRWRRRARTSSASARSACRPAPPTAASSGPTARSAWT